MKEFFNHSDLEQMVREQLTWEAVSAQLDMFRQGMKTVTLNRPCRLGDGIITIKEEERPGLLKLYEKAAGEGRLLKFVPASGAASRMFDGWLKIFSGDVLQGKEVKDKIPYIDYKKFAFYPDICHKLAQQGKSLDILSTEERILEMVSLIMNQEGLDYLRKPKALIKFHRYTDGSRTALEEHLVEAALYARDKNGCCRIHFTVSEEHLQEVASYLEKIKGLYEQRFKVVMEIGLSCQEKSTQTIALGRDGLPFRDKEGKLVFRPGGHGTLLSNLEQTKGDIVFIKNIDNVAPDRLKGETILYKKLLAGYYVKIEGLIFSLLERISSGQVGKEELDEARYLWENFLNQTWPADFVDLSLQRQSQFLIDRLDRPLRVCGVVKNEGEPGGGPFFIEEEGTISKQIVEEFQINKNDPSQLAIWSQATHFNPVDLVCGLKNWQGRRFSLKKYVDERYFAISEKTKDGQALMALEMPGLWNGGMGFWNTIFVEVPLSTFTPVKTVADLLRIQHQEEL